MSVPKISDALRQHFRQADRLMVIILWGMVVVALALSSLHDTLGWALVVGIPAAMIPTIVVAVAGGTRLSRMVTAVALVALCALHIHQGAGRDELHFGIFVALAFLLCYRDWTVIVVAAAVVALHHMSFNYLQELGYGVICLARPGFGVVLVHAGYVVAETAVLCYLAVILHREALQSAELRVTVAELRNDATGAINLGIQSPAASESGKALQDVMRLMGTALARVQDSVRTTTAASAQIARGNAELRSRTARQGSSIRAMVDSMAELTATVHRNAEHARQADMLAGTASSVAVHGGDVVAQVVQRMQAIDASAHKIADIISVIDGIAFQTNILALNAAVEAARAGEQGRGFAVVASEVRNLAQRSAGAAREIKALIEESVSQVGAGSELVHQAGRTMDEVVASVSKVSGIIAEISSASRAQAEEISVIGQSMQAMDRDTHESAGMVNEAAEAASALKSQAEELAKVVSVFHIDDGASTPRRPLLAA